VSEPALTVLDRGQRIPLDLRRLQTIIEIGRVQGWVPMCRPHDPGRDKAQPV
jgi:hypothetical protein